jgi:hypothetical protein
VVRLAELLAHVALFGAGFIYDGIDCRTCLAIEIQPLNLALETLEGIMSMTSRLCPGRRGETEPGEQ